MKSFLRAKFYKQEISREDGRIIGCDSATFPFSFEPRVANEAKVRINKLCTEWVFSSLCFPLFYWLQNVVRMSSVCLQIWMQWIKKVKPNLTTKKKIYQKIVNTCFYPNSQVSTLKNIQMKKLSVSSAMTSTVVNISTKIVRSFGMRGRKWPLEIIWCDNWIITLPKMWSSSWATACRSQPWRHHVSTWAKSMVRVASNHVYRSKNSLISDCPRYEFTHFVRLNICHENAEMLQNAINNAISACFILHLSINLAPIANTTIAVRLRTSAQVLVRT